MTLRSIFVLILLPITLFSQAASAYAEEIVVTVEGNGSGSSNEVHVQSSSSTTVEQNNTANVNNNVEANANTGDNQANHNNSENTNIQTGDAHVETNVSNTNINSNSANTPSCNCDSSTNINVSGNGSSSTNVVATQLGGGDYTNQNNTANIYNNVVTNANTGYNSAVANNGDVGIKTGNIYAKTTILNDTININSARDFGPLFSNTSIDVSGNGSASTNIITHNDVRETVYAAINTANIYNNVEHNLNTGHNKADFNLGDVWIGTGDIVAITDIINQGINVNDYTRTCECDKPGEEVTPPPVTPPSNPPHHNGESRDNGNGGGGGGVGGDEGEILPTTGGLTYLWMTLAALILFFAGWYLRFRSGIAPGVEALS